MQWISTIFGEYTRNFMIEVNIVLNFLFCALLYARQLKKRSFFLLRLATVFLCLLGFCVLMSYGRDGMHLFPIRILVSVIEYCIPLFVLLTLLI